MKKNPGRKERRAAERSLEKPSSRHWRKGHYESCSEVTSQHKFERSLTGAFKKG